MRFLDNPPRFLFFTGKGGVGKTSIACATAVQLADGGKRVMLVSTDPASNVGQVFGVTIGNRITPLDDVPGLSALESDPQAAAQAYRDLRLLQLPGAWSGFLEAGKGDASCLGPLAGLEKQQAQYKAAVDALADARRTRLILVARAQQATLHEAARMQRVAAHR